MPRPSDARRVRLGRWIGHLHRGHWMHLSIARATPVRGESWIGWCAHYSIGITFSALLLWTYGLEWARSPSLLPALFIGIVTVVAPLLILQPGMGAGLASWKTPTPVFDCIKSLVTHRLRPREGALVRASTRTPPIVLAGVPDLTNPPPSTV